MAGLYSVKIFEISDYLILTLTINNNKLIYSFHLVLINSINNFGR